MPDLIVNLGFRRVKFPQLSGPVTTVQEQRTVRATLRTVARDLRCNFEPINRLIHMGQLLRFGQLHLASTSSIDPAELYIFLCCN